MNNNKKMKKEIAWKDGHSVAIIKVTCSNNICVKIPKRECGEYAHEDFTPKKNANAVDRRNLIDEIKNWVNNKNHIHKCSINRWRHHLETNEIEMEIEPFERRRNGITPIRYSFESHEKLKKHVWVSEEQTSPLLSHIPIRIMAPKLRKSGDIEWMDLKIKNIPFNYTGIAYKDKNLQNLTINNFDCTKKSSADHIFVGTKRKEFDDDNNNNNNNIDPKERMKIKWQANGLREGLRKGPGKTGIMYLYITDDDEKGHFYYTKRTLKGTKVRPQKEFRFKKGDLDGVKNAFHAACEYIINPVSYMEYEETEIRSKGLKRGPKTTKTRVDPCTDISSIPGKHLDPIVLNLRYEEYADPDYNLVMAQMIEVLGSGMYHDDLMMKMEQNNNNSMVKMQVSHDSVNWKKEEQEEREKKADYSQSGKMNEEEEKEHKAE